MLTFTFLWLDLSLNHFHYQVWFCKFKHMSPLLCNVMLHMLVVVYWCCGQPAGTIFDGQDCRTLEDGADRLSETTVNSYWHTQHNITQQQRSQLNLSWNSHRHHDTGVPFDVYFTNVCCLPLVTVKIFQSWCGFTSSLLPYTFETYLSFIFWLICLKYKWNLLL